MTITIPTWVLWALGVPCGIAVLVFAAIGVYMVWAFKDGVWR